MMGKVLLIVCSKASLVDQTLFDLEVYYFSLQFLFVDQMLRNLVEETEAF